MIEGFEHCWHCSHGESMVKNWLATPRGFSLLFPEIHVQFICICIVTQKIFPLQLLPITIFLVYSRYAFIQFIPTRRSGSRIYPICFMSPPIAFPWYVLLLNQIPQSISKIPLVFQLYSHFFVDTTYTPISSVYAEHSHLFPIPGSVLTYCSTVFLVNSQYAQLWEFHFTFPITTLFTYPLYFRSRAFFSRTSMGFSRTPSYHIKPTMGAYQLT